MSVGRCALASAIAASLAACALFTDTSGFSNGSAVATGADGGGDAATTSADAADDAAADAPSGPSFHDDFARGDGPDVGNGWTEKNPDAYSLVSGAVRKEVTSVEYRDNLVFRPESEDRADVEVAATFTLGEESAYPQVFARAMRSTIAEANMYDAYIFFLSGPAAATLARQRGAETEVVLATISLLGPVNADSRVRLTLRTTGTTPVTIEAFVDEVRSAATSRLGEAKTTDATADRLDAAGATGFAASFKALPAIDDFAWRAVP